MPTLAEAKETADRGAIQQARLMYETIIQENPRSEDAWLGLADVLTDIEDKRVCYKNVLKINKKNRAAKEGLRSLEPQTDTLRGMFDIPAAEESGGGAAAAEPESYPEDDKPVAAAAPTRTTRPTKKKRTSKKKRNSTAAAPKSAPSETPTSVLVAVGLALSLVVFTIGAGVFYYVATALFDG